MGEFEEGEVAQGGGVKGKEEAGKVGEGLLNGSGCLVGLVGVADGCVCVGALLRKWLGLVL